MPWQSPSKSTCDATQASPSGVSYRRSSGRAAEWPAGLILTQSGHLTKRGFYAFDIPIRGSSDR